MSEEFSFIHAADLHLDSPFSGFEQCGDVDGPEKENVLRQLRNCTFDALDNIVAECIRYQVDFLVLSGDVYDSGDRGMRAELHLKKVVEKLGEHGILVFIAYGNHDYDRGNRARLSWPSNVYFFSAGEVDCFPVTRQGKEIARIYGISYPCRDVQENYALRFKRQPGDPFAVGVLHCNAGGAAEHANYAPCKIENLINAGMDYWALGHVHTREVLRGSGPCIVYPGIPQGRNPREAGEKGCYLVNVSGGGPVELTFLSVDSVRWTEINVSIDDMQVEEDLLKHLDAELRRVAGDFSGRSVVCRFNLTGRGSLHSYLRHGSTASDILTELRRNFTAAEGPFVWPESIRCCTGQPVDIENAGREETLLGDLLSLGKEAYANEDLRQQLRDSMVSLEKRASPHVSSPGEEEFNELIEEALDLAADLLWEEE
ncbi:MAG: DNA repair exonuclease [Clostridiales bacterium]|nr:DNA repair exonuclease [Clostridiales bacterium]MCF8023097.1 DNA repair exonuclease [Clostridiales bacterium]